jgi:hypothetical protein
MLVSPTQNQAFKDIEADQTEEISIDCCRNLSLL